MLSLEKPVVCSMIPQLANINLRTLPIDHLAKVLKQLIKGDYFITRRGEKRIVDKMTKAHIINCINLIDKDREKHVEIALIKDCLEYELKDENYESYIFGYGRGSLYL